MELPQRQPWHSWRHTTLRLLLLRWLHCRGCLLLLMRSIALCYAAGRCCRRLCYCSGGACRPAGRYHLAPAPLHPFHCHCQLKREGSALRWRVLDEEPPSKPVQPPLELAL